MSHNDLPSQTRIHELFDYDETTGNLIYKQDSGNRHIGDIAGTTMSSGYVIVSIDDKRYLAHRIIWVYHTGSDPKNITVDHKNRNPSDNRFENLRLANQSQQNANTNSKNVQYDKHRKKWKTRIGVNGTQIHLGYYSSELIARAVYETAAAKHFGEFAPLTQPNPFCFTNLIWGHFSDGTHKGVDFQKHRNKWRARIWINGAVQHLGNFESKEEARLAVIKAQGQQH